jgi:hypothetical protein
MLRYSPSTSITFLQKWSYREAVEEARKHDEQCALFKLWLPESGGSMSGGDKPSGGLP